MTKHQRAEAIYDVLTKQRFRDFYEGKFVEHISDSRGPSKDEIIYDILALFDKATMPSQKRFPANVDGNCRSLKN